MMMTMRSGLSLLVPLLSSWQSAADLPVHCVRHQVVGDWVFKLGPLSEARSVCGHERPDVQERQPAREVVDSQAGDIEISLSLSSPNLVKSGKKQGTWTMVYDEGFEVNVDGQSFFAFSNFTFEKNAEHPTEKPHNVSHCGQTMVGWYRDAHRTKFGCYYGYKRGESQQAVTQQAAPTIAKPSPKKSTFDTPLDHKAQKKAVSKLNKRLAMLQLGWRAHTVKKWNGQSMRQINQYVGLKRSVSRKALHKEILQQQGHAANRMHARRSFLQRVSELPKSLDWGDVNGRSFLEPVMDQADCGSCYAASSVRMLSARHKIKLNDTTALPWSINFPLQCSEYNQGCNGGYGFLLAKWSEDVGLLPATCMRYDTQGTCKLECDLKSVGKRYRVANHRYVGSFYGRANEQILMEELVHNGPLAVGIEPDEDFMYYADGIYRSSKPQNHSGSMEWEQVDHGVLLVGYGEEDGQKYWKIQNSWGPDWGEDGFFRILRGTDESAIESMGEAADVVEDEQKGRRVDEMFAQLRPKQDASVQKHSL
jgi:cathepsin C